MHKKKRPHFDLHIHKLGRKSNVIKIIVNGKEFYGSFERDRITISPRIVKILDLRPNKIYQFKALPTTLNKVDNSYLFIRVNEVDYNNCTKNDYLLLDKLLSNLQINTRGKFIEVYCEDKHGHSKKMKIPRRIELNKDLFSLFGLFKADGTKANAQYFDLTSTNIHLLKYFIVKVSEIFKLPRTMWSIMVKRRIDDLRTKGEIKKWVSGTLKVSCSRISIYSSDTKGKIGISARIDNKTAKEIMIDILKFIQNYVLSHKKFCGYFISGILAGDGYLCTENNRVKRIELYFDPNKVDDEGVFYLNCLKFLGLDSFNIRIYYDSDNKMGEIKAENIANILRQIFHNVKILPKKNLLGIGRTIFIHKREDIKKLSQFDLFYPNEIYNKKFYECWL